jgi:tol-pal system beta propeller repeat protein TolB
MISSQKLLAGFIGLVALAPALHAQTRNQPVAARPKPQRPLDVPPAVVVLPVDTTAGDSTRAIIQRDFDFGDRIQSLILDDFTLADVWQPGGRRINFAPLAQTRANYAVRLRTTTMGLHVEVYGVPGGLLRQQGDFRLPRIPAYRLPAVRDSLNRLLAVRTTRMLAAVAADSARRDSIAAEAARPVPLKHPGQRVAARRSAAQRDSIIEELNRRDSLLLAAAAQDTARFDSVFSRLSLRDSVVRDSLGRERRLGIHNVSDEVERWITGTRGIASTKIAFIDGGKLKIVDSDGANERTIPTVGAALSPAWHPSGHWLVYVDADDQGTRIAQVDLRTMRPRLLTASTRGLNITPVYTKDGKSIVWASGGDLPAELMLASADGDDTAPKPFVGRSGFETTSPSFSPDGKQLAFISPRPLTPQVYTMSVDGTGLRLLTPVVPGKRIYRTSPDWSPTGTEVAYMQQAGDFQVWVIGVKDRVMKQLTTEGENEDPSWAPDGRHLSITRRLGPIGAPRSIWILDEKTGRQRQLTVVGDARLSDWSPALKPGI